MRTPLSTIKPRRDALTIGACWVATFAMVALLHRHALAWVFLNDTRMTLPPGDNPARTAAISWFLTAQLAAAVAVLLIAPPRRWRWAIAYIMTLPVTAAIMIVLAFIAYRIAVVLTH